MPHDSQFSLLATIVSYKSKGVYEGGCITVMVVTQTSSRLPQVSKQSATVPVPH